MAEPHYSLDANLPASPALPPNTNATFPVCYGIQFTSMAILRWSQQTGSVALFAPGKLQQNSFVECFNGHLRDELLNKTSSLDHARGLLADPRGDYNLIPPHSSIANLPLATYAKLTATDMQRDGPLY